jgi:stage V sporulation protein B
VATILQGIGKTYLPMVHMVIGLILKLIINYNLISIPQINIKGAIAGSAVCYIFAFYMNYRSIRKLTGVRLDVKRLFNRPLSVSVIMGLFVLLTYEGTTFMTGWLIKSFFLQNLICTSIAIVSGMIIYYLLMIIAKGITAEDIKNLPKGRKILDYTVRIPFMRKYLIH